MIDLFGDHACLPTLAELRKGSVHIWCAPLDVPPRLLEQLEQTLSTDERIRASRFHFERDRQHFVACRGLLRSILSRYLGMEPDSFGFRYGPQEKPVLLERAGTVSLEFNVSHSHRVALFAIALDRRLGIDIEYVRPVAEMEQIARRLFSPREKAELLAMPVESKPEAFFRCWTRKEAFVKAMGDGLARPVDRIEISPIPEESTRIVDTSENPLTAVQWSFQQLVPVPGYMAAVVSEGPGVPATRVGFIAGAI